MAIHTHFFPATRLGADQQAPTAMPGPGLLFPGSRILFATTRTVICSVAIAPLRDAGYDVVGLCPSGFVLCGGEADAVVPEARLDTPGGHVLVLVDRARHPPDRPGLDGQRIELPRRRTSRARSWRLRPSTSASDRERGSTTARSSATTALRQRVALRLRVDFGSPPRSCDEHPEHPLQLPSPSHCGRWPALSFTPPSERHQHHDTCHPAARRALRRANPLGSRDTRRGVHRGTGST